MKTEDTRMASMFFCLYTVNFKQVSHMALVFPLLTLIKTLINFSIGEQPFNLLRTSSTLISFSVELVRSTLNIQAIYGI